MKSSLNTECTREAKGSRGLLGAMRLAVRRFAPRFERYLFARVYFWSSVSTSPPDSFIFFPLQEAVLHCGLAGIVAFKRKNAHGNGKVDLEKLAEMVDRVVENRCPQCRNLNLPLDTHHFGGNGNVEALFKSVTSMRKHDHFFEIIKQKEIEKQLEKLSERLDKVIDDETAWLSDHMGYLASEELESVSQRIERLKDIVWSLKKEVVGSIQDTLSLAGGSNNFLNPSATRIYKEINAVLNSLDRLEVRGRDSSGISIMFHMNTSEFVAYLDSLKKEGLFHELEERSAKDLLRNRTVTICRSFESQSISSETLVFTYKIAAEVGGLGDNIRFIRQQIQNDRLLQGLAPRPIMYHTISAHTRWASVGAISEANCHPLDNGCALPSYETIGTIHACLNGDIDNYLELRRSYEGLINDEVSTDTKIIPLHIQGYLKMGCQVEDAFRLAVNDFKGSHAISMHTDLAPGKVFLAQRGSGQAFLWVLPMTITCPHPRCMASSRRLSAISNWRVMPGRMGRTEGTRGKFTSWIKTQRADLDGISAISYDGNPIEIPGKGHYRNPHSFKGYRSPGLSPLFSSRKYRKSPKVR